MICLGIESTAHTFGVGIVSNKKVFSNVKRSYVTEKGGIIPMNAAMHHKKVKEEVLRDALVESKLSIDDVNFISFSQGPGIAPCLLQGMELAKNLAKQFKKPLVPVNHCVAHLEVGKFLTDSKDPVLLYVSGANTQIIAYEGKRYRIFGETLDQGVGNFLDAFARYVGLGFPGGPKIDKLAQRGKDFIELPYSVKGMDMSFTGILTNLKQKYDSEKYSIEDLSYSLQETAFAMLLEVSERAMAHLGKNELLLGGGVGCNNRIREMCEIMCKERGAKFYCPPNEFLVDNAAMIAVLGLLAKEQSVSWKNLCKVDIKPYQRTDEVTVTWA